MQGQTGSLHELDSALELAARVAERQAVVATAMAVFRKARAASDPDARVAF